MKTLDPVVVSHAPAHAQTNISPLAQVVFTFSKPMDTNSVQEAFSLTPPTGGTFTWSGLTTMTFTAMATLPVLTTNVVRITTNAMDSVSSNTFFAPFETYFVTAPSTGGDVNPPSVAINVPVNDSTITGLATVSGTASDDVMVMKVEVRLDTGAWLTASGTTNWNYSLDSANFLNGTHTLSARATDSSGNISPIDSRAIRFVNVPGNYLARISAGSFADVTNCDATVWLKDRAYSLGSFGFVGGSPGFVGDAITNVCLEAFPLYQRERFGASTNAFRYSFDCPEGLYETTLLESETRTNAANARVFNVLIESQQVATNLDLFAVTGGQFKPLTLVFTNAVTDAQLHIEFSPVLGSPRASGIQVRRIADLDTDGDGIPDWWTRAYFDHPTGQAGDKSLAGDDADGDGMSNLEEFLSGTDPTSRVSVLRITSITPEGNHLRITWTLGDGKTNALEATPGASGHYTNNFSPIFIVTNTVGPATNYLDIGGATNWPARFFRVRIVP